MTDSRWSAGATWQTSWNSALFTVHTSQFDPVNTAMLQRLRVLSQPLTNPPTPACPPARLPACLPACVATSPPARPAWLASRPPARQPASPPAGSLAHTCTCAHAPVRMYKHTCACALSVHVAQIDCAAAEAILPYMVGIGPPAAPVCTHARTHAHTHACTHACTHVCTHAHILSHGFTRSLIHARMYVGR